MIRRFLSIWLILSIFGYGIAMAAEIHSSFDQDHEHSIQDHSDNRDHNDVDNCDHCCHGGLHLLGLHSNHRINVVENSKLNNASHLVNYVSPDTQRLNRPPAII